MEIEKHRKVSVRVKEQKISLVQHKSNRSQRKSSPWQEKSQKVSSLDQFFIISLTCEIISQSNLAKLPYGEEKLSLWLTIQWCQRWQDAVWPEVCKRFHSSSWPLDWEDYTLEIQIPVSDPETRGLLQLRGSDANSFPPASNNILACPTWPPLIFRYFWQYFMWE